MYLTLMKVPENLEPVTDHNSSEDESAISSQESWCRLQIEIANYFEYKQSLHSLEQGISRAYQSTRSVQGEEEVTWRLK